MKYSMRHHVSDTGRVKRALDQGFQTSAERLAAFSPRIEWKSDHEAFVTFAAMGKTFQANVAITGDEVVVEGKVPFLFKHFEDRIRQAIGERLSEWLSDLQAGEGDSESEIR